MDRQSATVEVPATTANLGAGYDCLGLALALHNEVRLALADADSVEVDGEGADSLPRDRTHLVLGAAQAAADAAGRHLPRLTLRQLNRIPLARGLGSSSAAIVGGVVAANELLGLGLTDKRMVEVAARVEGHPDNVAPALLGGLTVCCTVGDEVLVRRLDVASGLACVVAIPDFEVATHDARRVLPQTVPHEDAVFNLSRASLTIAALVSGSFELLAESTRDRLHQRYRAPLTPGAEEAMEAALEAGAYGAALSGSGPTVAAFVGDSREEVGQAMVNGFQRAGIAAESRVLALSHDGARVIE